MAFLAHSENSAGQGHLLPDHLRAVAELCRNFSAEFGAGEAGYWTGLWHDLGKFASDFQGHLMAPIGRQGPDHSTAGALMASSSCEPLAFPVAGHHSGLPDLETLKNRLSVKGPALQSAIDLASGQLGQVRPSGPKVRYLPDHLCGGQSQPTQLEFFLRMLFSALVDADFLDTEAHFESDKAGRRGGWQSTNALWSRLEAAQDRLSGRKADTLNQIRHEVYQDCVQAASMPPGIFCLTVPTGGGKTRSAMAFALCHALAHGLRRVIMTIPYTSIIEQTADVYRDIFGNDAVLEHHSAVNWEQDDPTHERARLSSENWDAPIVVTTTVQLFESLFANRPSRCRKLHNIAGSVVILDEVQALPLGLLEPVLDVLQALADHYRVTVVLCSATPPAFFTGTYLKGLREVSEIVPEPERHFEALRRVRYELPAPGQQQSWAEVAQEIRSDNHCLAVVNTKADALALLDALGDPNAMHLSTSLCGAHRRDVLREIHRRLRAGEPCRLISTQVVEAGVDCVVRSK